MTVLAATIPTTMSLSSDEAQAYAYLRREVEREADPTLRVREPEDQPLGGLSLGRYKVAISRLVNRGVVIRTTNGRWVPRDDRKDAA